MWKILSSKNYGPRSLSATTLMPHLGIFDSDRHDTYIYTNFVFADFFNNY